MSTKPPMGATIYSHYRELRSMDPVHWDSKLNLWILTRYQDVVAALTNSALSSRRLPPATTELDEDARNNAAEVYGEIAGWMVRSDPPQHTRLRRGAAPALHDRVAAGAHEQIVQTARVLLDRTGARGGMDVVSDFAIPLSLCSIATIVGIPASDHGLFYHWANAVGAAAEASPNSLQLAIARKSLTNAHVYLSRALSERRAHPRRERDFLSALLEAQPGNERLNDNEMIGITTLLLLAGHETATHLIGNGVLALLNQPDELERLKANPKLWASAVQELFRYASPLHGVLRTATADVVVGGKTIREGEPVAISLAAANRDPTVFDNPEVLDVRRNPNPHIAFGRGIHYCAGASVGELIAGIGMRAMLERFPRLRLASREVEWEGNYLFRGQRRLRVNFE